MVAIAVELATAYVSLTASAKGIAKSIQSELGDPLDKAGSDAGEKSSKSFGTSFKNGLGTVAKAGAVAFGAAFVGAVAFGKSAISAAGDLSESMSKVEVVFGDAASGVVDWSKKSSTAFGQSQQSALEAAGTYGNLFQAFGLQQKPAQEMSQSLVELAADLASFNNTSVDEALQALQSGVSGETEPLKRYGVAINDVRLKEEALALGLISSTKDALTPAAKAQASYALIMKDTALAQGDFERTSGGLANQQRIMSAEWKNAQAAIGKALLPAMTAVVSFIASKLIPKITDIAEVVLPALQDAFQSAAAWVKRVWPQVQRVIVEVFDRIVSIWGTYVQPALAALWDALKSVWSFVIDNQPVLIGVLAAIGVGLAALFAVWVAGAVSAAVATLAAIAPFIAIGAAIAAVVAGVIYAYQNWEWFRTVVDGVRAWIVDTLWPALQNVFGWLRDNVPPILQAIAGFFADVVWPAMQKVWDFVVTYLWPAFQAYAEFMVGVYKTAILTAVDVITTLWGWLETLWDRSEGLRSFLAAAFVAAFNATSAAIDIVSTAVSTVWGWLQTFWDRAEPLRAFLAGAFWLAITTISTAWDAISTAVSAVWSWFQTIWDKAVEVVGYFEGAFKTGLDVAAGAWDVVSEAAGKVVDIIRSVIEWAGKALSPLQKVIDAAAAVKDIITGDIATKAGGPLDGSKFDVPGRASGGPVVAGRPYVVGEGGWELIVPKHSGTVLSHDESVAATSGATFTGPMFFYDEADLDGFARSLNMQLAGV